MDKQTKPLQKLQIPQEPIPCDDARDAVGEILKRIDQLISHGDLIHAQMEITNAKAMDPSNPYIFALEKYISFLKTESVHLEEIRHNDLSSSSSVTGNIPTSETGIPQMPESSKPGAPAPAAIAPSRAPAQRPAPPAVKPQAKLDDCISDRSSQLESYRRALTDAWSDGALTDDEKRQLNEQRAVYGIPRAIHEHIEKHVKYECYRNALLLQQMSSNSMTPSVSKSVGDLQRTYQISDAEHLSILTQLITAIQHKQRDKILLIDDDTNILELYAASLKDNGFDVTALPTSDEAYALLKTFTPDLILCDVDLETSTMVGLSFYERIQELQNVKGIPFIFITGLKNETLVRSGRELGADDYLMKPISEQMLVSTLHGKLKRFRQLNKKNSAPLSFIAAA